MAPRKKQKQGPSSSRAIPDEPLYDAIDPDYKDVRFQTPEQFERFKHFKVRKIVPTRWFDHNALQTLGIHEQMGELCQGLGLFPMFNMYYQTFPQLTLEFLSSLMPARNHDNVNVLVFRLNNTNHTLTIAELARAFGLRGGNIPLPTGPEMYQLWQAMTGMINMDTSNLNMMVVQHPTLRIFLKWLSVCLFARPGSHCTRTNDVWLLVQRLRPDAGVRMHLPLLLWKHLLSITRSGSSQPILIGGLVTRLAVFLNHPDESQPNDRRCMLTLSFLHNCKFIRKEHTQLEWKLLTIPEPTFVDIPVANLPPLTPNLDHYLLRGEIPQVAPPPPPVPPQPRPYVMQAPNPAMPGVGFEQQVLDNFGRLHLSIGSLASRVERLEEDQRRAFNPLYTQYYKQELIPGDVPYPSWFRIPADDPWDGAGGSRGQGSGGDGGGDGDGVDDGGDGEDVEEEAVNDDDASEDF